MQLPSSLRIGQRVDVRFGANWLPTRLEDLASDRLQLAWPTDSERRLIPLKPGDTVDIAVSAEDALYSAPARIEQARHEGLPLLTLSIVGVWDRSQRRNAVRVQVAIRPRVAARITDNRTQPLRAGISNLSANGVQLRSQDELKPGDMLDLAFSVMDVDEEIEAQAQVKRVQHFEQGTVHVWEAGCEFQQLPDRLQRKLLQFIFNQQRVLARARKAS
jgi:c-di-GMP-binding flagellar brake protein YcgR